MASEILRQWEVLNALLPEDLLVASDAMHQWIETHWAEATWHREWPLAQRQGDGSIIRGSSDLVLEVPSGFVLIDHKSFPGTVEQAMQKVTEFAGQLSTYSNVVEAATGRSSLATYVHLPLLGIVVKVSPSYAAGAPEDVACRALS